MTLGCDPFKGQWGELAFLSLSGDFSARVPVISLKELKLELLFLHYISVVKLSQLYFLVSDG